MSRVALLRSLPKTTRDIAARVASRTPETVAIARQFGYEYFDGPREYGLGGYHYDGRWCGVARDIVSHFDLAPGARILDVGCAKGFLVVDLVDLGMDAYGVDVSKYALSHCHPAACGRLFLGSADALPFTGPFDAVLSINTLHNLPREGVVRALRDIQRLSGGHAFVQVDAFDTIQQAVAMSRWVLTARTVTSFKGWEALFAEATYEGDYDFTVME